MMNSTTTKYKVLMTDHPWPDVRIERNILAQVPAELIVAEQTDEASLTAAAADVDAIMTCWSKVSEKVMTASGRCRVVARMGIGLDNIDVSAATRHKILVTNVPEYCIDEVAEHALALLLALARKAAFYHHQSKSGRYAINEGPALRRIAGKTLGIVGLGRIGRKLAAKALGLELNVVACDTNQSQPMPGVTWCNLDELFSVSDFVSLHAPLTPATRHLIDAARLAHMKPTAYLINTSRGGLIDTKALADAIQSGKLAGAALDVQDPEPPDLSQPPYNDPRVIVTPHVSFLSEESLEDLRTQVAHQVADVLCGNQPDNIVNPEVIE